MRAFEKDCCIICKISKRIIKCSLNYRPLKSSYKNPNNALVEVKGVSGVNDSGKGDTDYLECTSYAKAIVQVAQKIEEPKTP